MTATVPDTAPPSDAPAAVTPPRGSRVPLLLLAAFLLLGGGWATTPVPVGFVNDIARIPV